VGACEVVQKGYILINTRTKNKDAPKLLPHDKRERHKEKASKKKKKKKESTQGAEC
jgi:hypothetical protein